MAVGCFGCNPMLKPILIEAGFTRNKKCVVATSTATVYLLIKYSILISRHCHGGTYCYP